MPTPLVADLSHHNIIDDLAEAKAAGLVGIIQKCTEGANYFDPTYDARKMDAKLAGLKFGAYHFMRPGSMRNQAHWFLEKAGDVSRLVADFEDEALTLGDLKAFLQAIMDRDPSRQLCVYSGHLLKELLGTRRDTYLAGFALWIAHYTTAETPSWPTGTWPNWSLWQYTDGALGGSPRSFPGLGNVDLNAWNGTPANCAKWFGTPSAQPSPAQDEIVVTVRVPPGVRVKVERI